MRIISLENRFESKEGKTDFSFNLIQQSYDDFIKETAATVADLGEECHHELSTLDHKIRRIDERFKSFDQEVNKELKKVTTQHQEDVASIEKVVLESVGFVKSRMDRYVE